MNKQKIVVFTGAGISVESGIETYRGDTGLWHQHDIRDVCHPEGWHKDPQKVLEFYNQRRKEVAKASPNAAHLAIAQLESQYDVTVITQNVDDLHERAGSSKILHLHGEVTKVRSDLPSDYHLYDIGYDAVNIGQRCESGLQLRPHIVWFAEEPFFMEESIQLFAEADKILVVGTSLQVQPAASLILFAHSAQDRYIIDPSPMTPPKKFDHLRGNASDIVPRLVNSWLSL
ncbi:SIR2 family NAD-dependent protein deacylase [Marinomonas fungiae]|uniref:protein acetyllysine N-acetyltransferase n=1 Tax=Marinomonas fungiae TaxID=1137284 RepID=A0A0K6IIP4_9GAMM|nr:Sir2 family NAD-dependent protein deacetylase [Marinomonas fungiae]CUB03187.1 NAD-dependent protein deacetylase, SIR2 family [Marinomonas fungiae]